MLLTARPIRGFLTVFVLTAFVAQALAERPRVGPVIIGVDSLPEIERDPPASAETLRARTTSPPMFAARGSLVSVQVNVDSDGLNIVGDAANEPTIAINPQDPTEIVIAWRQFDSILSDFRQAGNAYSADAGATWTFPGVLDPGQFRSDPVLGTDLAGNFYLSSLSAVDSAEVFKSSDGGVNWGSPVSAFGGDKQWLAVHDVTGLGNGNVYQNWNSQFSCCGIDDFTRSINGAASFPETDSIPSPKMKWGTLDVGTDGTLYLAGAELNSFNGHLFTKSANAKNPVSAVSFDAISSIDLGGFTATGGINPQGLLGQVWIATDHSTGPTDGNIYVLGSVVVDASPNVTDVMFIRSTDGGANWTDPIQVNDDSDGAWHWFGTMSVAPNGRIDVVWNDTRNDPGNSLTELFYSFSLDAGLTFSPNVPVSPAFDPSLGYPQQNKLGDYYGMISDNTGAGVAYAATFNGEQDVYYLRIPGPPTCPLACGDLNDSGGPVNLVDFATFANCFGFSPSSVPECVCSDLNGDLTIDLNDFSTFALDFGGVSTNTPPNCP